MPGPLRRAGRRPVRGDSGPSRPATQHGQGLEARGRPPAPLGVPRLPSATLRPLPHLCQGQSGQEPGVLCPCCPQPFIGGGGVGSKWGEPQSHPALDGKSSGGWGEEPAPEKIQPEREAEGARAPKPTVSHERSSTHPARRRRVLGRHRPHGRLPDGAGLGVGRCQPPQMYPQQGNHPLPPHASGRHPVARTVLRASVAPSV